MTDIKRGPTDYMAETILAYIRENAELKAQNERLLSQLPEGMKDCTILFKQCEKGHGEFTAVNWQDHACPYCQIDRLNAALKESQIGQGKTTTPIGVSNPSAGPQACPEMPQYQGRKDLGWRDKVWALRIFSIHPNGSGGSLITPMESYPPVCVSRDYMTKNKPQPGGYYVKATDGYESYVPAEAFESGYTRI